MKRLWITMLVCLLLSVAAFAEESDRFISGDFECVVLEDGTTEIIRYNGAAEDLEVPDKLDGHAVTSIGNTAFAYRDMSSITLPK